MNKKIMIFGGVLIGFAALFMAVTSRQVAQTKKTQREEPTTVERGKMTDREREYSKEYKKLYPDREAKKMTALSKLGARGGNEKEVGMAIGEPSVPTFGESNLTPPIAPLQYLTKLSCGADAVVVGTASGKSSQMTEDESFVYSKYEFLITDVLKNNSRSPINPSGSIEVTRPGGLIKLDGQVIRVEDKSYRPFDLNQQYLLFLRYLPGADGYVVSNERGNFAINRDSYLQAGRPSPELANLDNPHALMDNIRVAGTQGCN